MSWEIRQGDCIKRMAEMEEASADAVVCDPPAGIAFMGKSWDRDRGGRDRWIEWLAEVMGEALRVCKPGAHALVWALPRTSHWTATALEDAGWEVRDRIAHHFGTGFPKSKDLGDGFGTALKPATEDWWLCRKPFPGSATACYLDHGTGGLNIDACRIGPGVGAGRWPASVVLSHLEECEEVGTKRVRGSGQHLEHHGRSTAGGNRQTYGEMAGVTGSDHVDDDGLETVAEWKCAPGCPVAELDAQSGVLKAGFMAAGTEREGIGYQGGLGNRVRHDTHGDSGGASRFFYCAKPSRAERNAGLEGFEDKASAKLEGGAIRSSVGRDVEGTTTNHDRRAANNHPTVKPINLMRWLVRLVTPPDGLVLDPFLGSGTTGAAAVLEGFDFIGIEREADYVAIADARIEFWSQHMGREVEEVLGLHAASRRQVGAHSESGQLSMSEVAA